MTIAANLAAKGVILRAADGRAVLQPLNSSYELQLECATAFRPGQNVRGAIRCRARKIYSVTSGGGFVQPILGTPRIIQGRVVTLDATTIAVRAANSIFLVELPTGDDAIDLHSGAIAAGSIVNVVALPGASFEAI